MSEYEVIPQKAIDSLLANPEKAGGFDAVFGKGRSQEVLASNQPQIEPKKEVSPELGLWGKVWDSTGRAVFYGAQEAVNETIGAVESFDMWASQKMDGLGVPSRLQIIDKDGNFNPELKYYHESLEDNNFLGGTVGESGDSFTIGVVDQPQTIVGGVVGGISQFAVGFLGAGKLTKLTGLRGAFINGAIADAVVFDPNDPNVTGMLEEFGFDAGSVTDLLATNPDDPEYINRLRNATEGAALGGIVEAIGWGIRVNRARAAGRPEEAEELTLRQEEALKELDEAILQAAKDAGDDAMVSIDVAKQAFSDDIKIAAPRADADGQLNLDLGDSPVPRPEVDPATVSNKRFYLTPERTEKIRLQATLARGVDLGEKQADLSFRSLTTVTDFEDVIDEIAGTQAVLADEFTKIKGGDVQKWATVKAQSGRLLREMAEMTGENTEALIKRFQTANLGDQAKMAAEIHARSRYVLTVERELKDMQKTLSSALAGKPYDLNKFPGIRDVDHLKLAFMQRREVAANLLAGQDSMRSNVARAMNAMKMQVKGDAKLRELLKTPDAFSDVDAVIRAMDDPKNAGKSTVRVVDETLKSIHGIMDGINSFRINALLSGPGTQEVNMISNAIQMFYIPAHQAVGAAATGDSRMLIHAMRQVQGYTGGLMDAVGTALKAGWENDSILDAFSNKVEGDQMLRAITGVKAIDNTITLPSRFLMTMDEFFKQTQYRGRVFADANLEATEKGLSGQARTDYVKDYLRESYSDTGMATRGDALLQARRSTFTEPLEPGLASMLQAAAIKSPTIRFFVPFVRTPINILSQTFQHAPVLGMASQRWRADIAAGGPRAAQARGRQVVGAGLVAGAGYMAAQGLITGAGPSDPRVRAVWLKNNQPYSFKIDQEDGTTRWVSFARLEPLSNVFSIAADAVEIMNDEYNESEKTAVIQALMMSVMENTVNKTFTQGIYDAMSLAVGRPHEQEAAFKNFVASFVPNILNQTNGDDALREARSITDAVMARTHLYNGVDPKRNVLGEPVIRALPKYDPLGLTQADVRETDRVLEEISRVAILNQTVAGNPSKRLAGPNQIDLTQIDYKEGQTLYDRWVELTGTVEINGMNLRDRLEKEMATDAYRRAPDGKYGIGNVAGTKGSRIRSIIEAYRKKARSEVPEILELERAEKRGTGSILKEQVRSNRELFPINREPGRPVQRRTFEDLLK